MTVLSRLNSPTISPKRMLLLFAATVLFFSGVINIVGATLSHAAQGDYTWSQAATGLTGDQVYDSVVASSADGAKLVAATQYGGQLATSTNSGATWTQRTVASSVHNIYALTSSSDGTKLAALVSSSVYTSTDSGATWTARSLPFSTDWTSKMVSSSDGTHLTVVNGYAHVATSTDSGATWTQQAQIPSVTYYLMDLAASSDGMKLIAAPSGSSVPLYTSTDQGASWTIQAGSGTRAWDAVASSADGTKLVATEGNSNSGLIYTSTDSGVTWAATTATGHIWENVASSGDGATLLATTTTVQFPGNQQVNYTYVFYVSTDSGATWTLEDGSGALVQGTNGHTNDEHGWLAVSADASKVTVGLAGGSIYTSTNTATSWAQRTAFGGTRIWTSVASSADGTKLAAVSNGGVGDYIYTSSNSGTTWTQRGSQLKWNGLASSSDGTHLVAETDAQIFTSSDSGATWTGQSTYSTFGYTFRIPPAMSADGSTVAVVGTVDNAADTPGSLYISTDYGQTWTAANVSTAQWTGIALSADGTHIIASAGDYAGATTEHLYKSTDSGATWSTVTSAGPQDWTGVASSLDGTKLYATEGNTNKIIASSDSGLTWTEKSLPSNAELTEGVHEPIAVSANGNRLAVMVFDVTAQLRAILISPDSGNTWIQQTIPGAFTIYGTGGGLTMNSTGSKVATAQSAGFIYQGAANDSIAPSVLVNSSNLSSNPTISGAVTFYGYDAQPSTTMTLTLTPTTGSPIVYTTTSDTLGSWTYTPSSTPSAATYSVQINTGSTGIVGPYNLTLTAAQSGGSGGSGSSGSGSSGGSSNSNSGGSGSTGSGSSGSDSSDGADSISAPAGDVPSAPNTASILTEIAASNRGEIFAGTAMILGAFGLLTLALSKRKA